MTPMTKGSRSLSSYMSNLSFEEIQKERDELLGVTAEIINNLSVYIEAFLSSNCICVVGNEEAIAAFKKLAESQRPEHSLVSSIVFEDTNSNVMKTGEYAQVCTAIQLNKAIPLLLDMRDDLKEMKDDMKEMKGDIKEMKGDMKEMKGDMKEMKGDMKEMKGDMKVVRKNTDIIPQIHEEIKGMREDIQPGYAAQFRLVQADIRAIKERLGMS